MPHDGIAGSHRQVIHVARVDGPDRGSKSRTAILAAGCCVGVINAGGLLVDVGEALEGLGDLARPVECRGQGTCPFVLLGFLKDLVQVGDRQGLVERDRTPDKVRFRCLVLLDPLLQFLCAFRGETMPESFADCVLEGYAVRDVLGVVLGQAVEQGLGFGARSSRSSVRSSIILPAASRNFS